VWAILVLSRKKSEVVCIGEGIRIMVVDIGHDKVRLGITADPSIPVHRLEVFEAIQRANHTHDCHICGAPLTMPDEASRQKCGACQSMGEI
jgi:carbon storage regulator